MTPCEEETRQRLAALGGEGVTRFLSESLDGEPEAEATLTNLERWLHSTGSPRLYLEQVVAFGAGAGPLLRLLGASQHLADILIQNPELATAILDAREANVRPSVSEFVEEGLRLLAASSSQRHSLDRLRFLKQRHLLPIAACDLTSAWTQETVWQALSDLAEAIVKLAFDAVWTPFAAQRHLPPESPLSVLAFGKLGGRELNYSSDVDLVYVARTLGDERIERECQRFCEQFGRALSDKMGRGALYRVDLRLRPYGSAGPILRSLESLQGYYKLYAEPWEVQALIKSRVIAGAELPGWDSFVAERVYQPALSEASLAEMVSMRRRIEEASKGDDIKRGSGGIRDVEFICQAVQLAQGYHHPRIRERGTLPALRAIADEHLLDQTTVNALVEGYTFLRKLEHRAQMAGDRQTHTVPDDPASRDRLARLMGLDGTTELNTTLEFHRRTIQSLYRSILRQEPESRTERELLAETIGRRAPALWQWFDVLPEAAAYYRSLYENEGSLRRVVEVLEEAPALVPAFKNSLELSELLLSGEIEEEKDLTSRIRSLGPTDSPRTVAEALSSAQIAAATRWLLTGRGDLNETLSDIFDSLLRYCVSRLQGELEVIALGSYGCREIGPGSDIDLLLLAHKGQAGAEMAAQELLSFLTHLKRFGPMVEVDLRLRPEGRKGLLVRSYDGFGAYEVSDMEMWERFALGNARHVSGDPDALDLVRHAAYALPLTPERLQELLAMKGRIESERLKPQHVQRDIKLGHGGLNDIEWTVHLMEMRYPTATKAGETSSVEARIRNLGRASLFNALEVDGLLEARRYLLDLKTRLHLLDIRQNLVPENPDRLNLLAKATGVPDSNAFLRRHQRITDWTRQLFNSALERLKG